MARRRRSSRRPARRPRSRYRERLFTVTCSVCGEQMQVPVQPPQGVELTCVNCLREDDGNDDNSSEAQGVAK